MSKKLIISSVVGLLAIGALAFVPMSVNALTAQNQARAGSGYGGVGGSGNGLVIKAKAMDMTTDQLKDQLQTKTIVQIATDQGMTLDQYHEKVQAAAQEQWKTMGLSDEEIKQRTEDQEQRQASCDGTGQNLGQGGSRNGQNR
jgi:hypothetical protein